MISFVHTWIVSEQIREKDVLLRIAYFRQMATVLATPLHARVPVHRLRSQLVTHVVVEYRRAEIYETSMERYASS